MWGEWFHGTGWGLRQRAGCYSLATLGARIFHKKPATRIFMRHLLGSSVQASKPWAPVGGQTNTLFRLSSACSNGFTISGLLWNRFFALGFCFNPLATQETCYVFFFLG